MKRLWLWLAVLLPVAAQGAGHYVGSTSTGSGGTIPPSTAAANTFWAGPASGGAGAPSFRAITLGDVPPLPDTGIFLTTPLLGQTNLQAWETIVSTAASYSLVQTANQVCIAQGVSTYTFTLCPPFIVNNNSDGGTVPTAPTGNAFQYVAQDSINPTHSMFGWGGSARYLGVVSAGTMLSPTAATAATVDVGLAGRANDGSGTFPTVDEGSVQILTSQAQTATHHGHGVAVNTTANNTTSAHQAALFNASGGLQLNDSSGTAPTGGDCGAGCINALGVQVLGNAAEVQSNKNAVSGYAGLDASGFVALAQTNPALIGTTDNRMINPDFGLDQRGEGASINPGSSGVYVTDGYFETQTQASKFSFARSTSNPPTGYSYSELVTVAAAVASPGSTDQWTLTQKILGQDIADFAAMGTGSAPTFQLEFTARPSATGTYCAYIHNQGRTRSYVVQYAGTANTWATYQYTIAGDTSGTWGSIPSLTTYGMEVGFDLGAGSTFQATVATWSAGNFTTTSACAQLVATNAATLQIGRVRLYPGSKALPYISKGLSGDYANARRFYNKTFPIGIAVTQNAGLAGSACIKNPIALGDPALFLSFAPEIMGGTTATVTTYNPSATNANWRDVTAASDVTVSVDPGSALGTSGVLIATSGTVATLGDVLCIHATWKKEL